jgi:hypothetical protein
MINILRTPQVRKAQKGVPTGSVYTTNERNLQVIGAKQLEDMLTKRDWSGVAALEFSSHEENTCVHQTLLYQRTCMSCICNTRSETC